MAAKVFVSHTRKDIDFSNVFDSACELGIDVCVLCDDVAVNFPGPYLNNYVTITIRNREAFSLLVKDLKKYETGMKTNFPDKKNVIECIYRDCKAAFNLTLKISTRGKIKCPQCLREQKPRKARLPAGVK